MRIITVPLDRCQCIQYYNSPQYVDTLLMPQLALHIPQEIVSIHCAACKKPTMESFTPKVRLQDPNKRTWIQWLNVGIPLFIYNA